MLGIEGVRTQDDNSSGNEWADQAYCEPDTPIVSALHIVL